MTDSEMIVMGRMLRSTGAQLDIMNAWRLAASTSEAQERIWTRRRNLKQKQDWFDYLLAAQVLETKVAGR